MTQRITALAAALAIALTGFFALPDAVDGQDAEPNEIRFVLTGIHVDEGGTIRCALYKDAGTWLNKARRFRRSSARPTRGQAACVFRNLPPGTYAMAALHDADGDREMAKTLIGRPKEGYAISRDEHDRLSRPDFNQAAVQFDGGRLVTRARMRY